MKIKEFEKMVDEFANNLKSEFEKDYNMPALNRIYENSKRTNTYEDLREMLIRNVNASTSMCLFKEDPKLYFFKMLTTMIVLYFAVQDNNFEKHEIDNQELMEMMVDMIARRRSIKIFDDFLKENG